MSAGKVCVIRNNGTLVQEGMFWHASSYAQPSPIESILEKESFTLEELLEEDDLIQETKSLNGRLIDFLKRTETVSKLLTLIVEPANEGVRPPLELIACICHLPCSASQGQMRTLQATV